MGCRTSGFATRESVRTCAWRVPATTEVVSFVAPVFHVGESGVSPAGLTGPTTHATASALPRG